jgi:heat shock protein HslJ
MTDEQMDARLRRAGEAWRAADSPATTLEPTDPQPLPLAPATRRRRGIRRPGLLASAAVVAAALIAGGSVLVANLGGGGAPPAENSQTNLVGTTWTLVRITGIAGQQVPVAGKPTLYIDANHRLTGNDGCNQVGGDVRVAATTLRFGALATTEMACPDPDVTATARHVDAMLSGNASWHIDGDLLTLTRPGAGELVYRATPPPTRSTDPKDLLGTPWNLTTVQSGSGPDGVASSVTGNLWLRLDATTPQHNQPYNLSFDDGCNANRAAAHVSEGALRVGIVVSTGNTCDLTVPAQQTQQILQVLKGELRWEIVGDQLTVTKAGIGALGFTRSTDLAQLTGTTWTQSTMSSSGPAGVIHSDSGPFQAVTTLRFDGAGHLTITHRCYANKGDVRIEDGTLDITAVTLSSALPCPATPEQQAEQDYNRIVDSALSGHSTWSINWGELHVTKGGTTIGFMG